MERPSDPAHLRVGLSLGSATAAGGGAASAVRLLTTLNEVMARGLNLARVLIVALPIVSQCLYIHSVDFVPWVLRLLAIYAILGLLAFLVVPEQLYNGIGMGAFRWVFEKVYPDIALANGSIAEASEHFSSPALAGMRAGDLSGVKVMLRWSGTHRFLCITKGGWAMSGDRTYATTFLLHQAYSKDSQKVPDTYTFRVLDPVQEWHERWLTFTHINHLRQGGWLGAFNTDPRKACPYKVIQDSSCPSGACKLLCAWAEMPLPTQRFCTGFYLAEQISGGEPYIGHAPDRDAAFFELAPITSPSS